MKHFLMAFVLAFGVSAFATDASAGCGACGDEGKPHTHEEGHNHDHEKEAKPCKGADGEEGCGCKGGDEAAACDKGKDCGCNKG